MTEKTYVIGVGMTDFVKPGSRDWDYPQMAAEAAKAALNDAGIDYDKIQQAVVGYVYGESTSGQRALYEVGLSGVPIYNVNNNCATGSSALFLARQLVQGGIVDCVLALGFDRMDRGSPGAKFTDRAHPSELHFGAMSKLYPFAKAPAAAQLFGNAAREHMERFGSKPEHYGKIAEKNHRHSAANPRAQFQTVYSLDEIMASPTVYDPLTRLQCCPTSEGAGAAVVCSERFIRENNISSHPVEIAGMDMRTDFTESFADSMLPLVGTDMAAASAQNALQQAGESIDSVDVIELHDCFSANELVTYESLGLCKPGQAHHLVDEGATGYGGRWVVNPSGGLISKGHPLGATGLAQCAELVWQLRGDAGERQVEGATLALQHNLGLGGACVVGVYRA